jgi:hypothetical protein
VSLRISFSWLTRDLHLCAHKHKRTPTFSQLYKPHRFPECRHQSDLHKKSDIKIYSHVVEGGSADSDQATLAPWPGHVTSQEEDGGLSKSQTSVFKFAKSTPALAQTPSKTQAQAHAQMRNETKTPARKQAAATEQVQTQQRKEGSSIHLSANQVYFSDQ